MTINRKLEIAVLSVCGLLGLVWATTTRHFPADGFSLDYLIDLSSLLTVASFSVRGILPLRLLAVASQIIAIPYFVLQAAPLWTPAAWTVLFLAINLYHVTRILLERRPIKFTAEEQRLYDLTFQSLEPRDFLKLVKFGEWKTAGQGDVFLTRGEPITHIAVPIAGTVTAGQGEAVVAQLGPGELIGAGIGLRAQPSPFKKSHLGGVGNDFQVSGFQALHRGRHGLGFKGLCNDAVFQGHPLHAAIILKKHLPAVSSRDVVFYACRDHPPQGLAFHQ